MARAQTGADLPPPFHPVRYAVLPSTNDEAKRLALQGAAAGTIVLADRQTKGRGRLDRDWESPSGNLYASIVLRPVVAAVRAVEVGFVAALAVADCIAALTPVPVTLKWPNDVLAAGRKIAGILLEAQFSVAEEIEFLILGIGLNVASHPENVSYPAASLRALGVDFEVGAVLRSLCEALNARLDLWQSEGFAAVRRDWLGYAHGRGHAVEVRVGAETVFGVFRDLDADGALLVETTMGLRRITAGDVRFDPL